MIWFGGRRPAPETFQRFGDGTLQGHLGMETVEVGDDFLRLRMPVDARTHQPFGRLHGGASVALAETAASMAATLCVDPERFVAVGVEINANHLRPAYSGWVTATARPESMGRSLHVWSIRIEDDDGRLVCISRFTAAVIPLERK
jgi:1,4-dihydroxy-2-naphthoyl-CoA hydrolase